MSSIVIFFYYLFFYLPEANSTQWGPGHHGDAEYEYEIHHYEKYHNEDSTEAELNHPEDIEHVCPS